MELAGSTPEPRRVVRRSGGYIAARHRVDDLVRKHISWQGLEAAIADLVNVDEDERSALWLYAWGSRRQSEGKTSTAAAAH